MNLGTLFLPKRMASWGRLGLFASNTVNLSLARVGEIGPGDTKSMLDIKINAFPKRGVVSSTEMRLGGWGKRLQEGRLEAFPEMGVFGPGT